MSSSIVVSGVASAISSQLAPIAAVGVAGLLISVLLGTLVALRTRVLSDLPEITGTSARSKGGDAWGAPSLDPGGWPVLDGDEELDVDDADVDFEDTLTLDEIADAAHEAEFPGVSDARNSAKDDAAAEMLDFPELYNDDWELK